MTPHLPFLHLRLGRVAVWLVFAVILGMAPQANARKCATIRQLAFERTHPGLTAIVQDRPWDPAELYVDSGLYPLRVHYPEEAFAEAADEVLGYLEEAWMEQVIQQGWPAPLADVGRGGDDRLDTYLVGLGGVDGLTLSDDDLDPDDGKQSAPVHLRINPASLALRNVVHHEFQHALQFALDARETLMFFEATAVYQEMLIRADDDDETWAVDVEEFQRYPQAPPFTDGVRWGQVAGEISLYEYGAVLLVAYIDETYGNGDAVLLREIWESSIQPDDSSSNEPDWMDALEEETSVPLRNMVGDFATWRALVGPLQDPTDGPDAALALDGSHLMRTRVLTDDSLRGIPLTGTMGFGAPHQLGCVATEVRARPGQSDEIEMRGRSLAEPPGSLFVSWAILGAGDEAPVRGVSAAGSEVQERVILNDGQTLLASFCDFSDPDADDVPEPQPVSVEVWNTSFPYGPEVVDAGPEPEADAGTVDAGPGMPPIVCACQQTPSPGRSAAQSGPFDEAKRVLFPLMLVIGLMVFVIRVRRISRARKTYQGAYRPKDAALTPEPADKPSPRLALQDGSDPQDSEAN